MGVKARRLSRLPQLSVQGLAGLLLALAIVPVVAVVGLVVVGQQILSEAEGRAQQAFRLQSDSEQFLLGAANERAQFTLFLYSGDPHFVDLSLAERDRLAAAAVRLQQDAIALRLSPEFASATRALVDWQGWADRSKAKGATPGSAPDLGVLLQGEELFSSFRAAVQELSLRAETEGTRALENVQTTQRVGRAIVMMGGTIATLIPLGLGLLFVGHVLRPIVRLAEGAHDLAAGHTSSVPALNRSDELGELSNALVAWQRAVTERMETEARFRAIFERAPVGVARLDLDGRVLECNPALRAILGCPEQQIVGRSLNEFMPPADAERYAVAAAAGGGSGATQLEARYLCGGREPVWGSTSVTEVKDVAGKPAFILVMVEDISERKAHQAALEHQALHDGLTGLPNRLLLHDRLQQAILVAQREARPLALLVMDLDRFKEVNDNFGHQYGDALLQEVARRLRSRLRESDTVARLGGDEFGIVLPGVKDQTDAGMAAAKLLQALAQPYALEHQALDIAASIGISLYPEHGSDAVTLLRRADVAMYVAKRGSGGFAIYEFKHDEQSLGQFVLVSELREAIEKGQLVLYYMPEVDVKTEAVVGVEALVRWQHPKFGLMAPDRFVPMAEQTGLIRPLTLWVLEAAMSQQEQWRREGINLTISVNLSTRNLHDPQLADAVARLIATYHVPRHGLKVEITESSLMADPDRALEVLTRLKGMGVLIAIDDFGTGYSSLAYLKRLRVDEIKIDKSFVFDMTSEDSDAAIVRSTIDLGHNLGLTVVAEGVETRDALNQLTADVCDYAQGYYLSRPLPADQIEAWLRQRQAA